MAVRIEYNMQAFRKIRLSDESLAVVRDSAERIAAACGGPSSGYFVYAGKGRNRARANVVAGTARSIRQNATENTLIRNLDAGRR